MNGTVKINATSPNRARFILQDALLKAGRSWIKTTGAQPARDFLPESAVLATEKNVNTAELWTYDVSYVKDETLAPVKPETVKVEDGKVTITDAGLRKVAAAASRCRRCAGTGQFITYVENGVPKGPGGICYRCQGKGTVTEADRRRNFGYDNYYAGTR